MKNVNLNLKFQVADNLSNEQIADKVKALLQKQLKSEKEFKFEGLSLYDHPSSLEDINIKILGKNISVISRDNAGGYESKLWEKATCKSVVSIPDMEEEVIDAKIKKNISESHSPGMK